MPATEPASDGASARGVFLSLDGPDGGGKTTQVARLADWLRARGRDVVTCREPGGTALGEGLRRILFDRATVHLTIRAEMFLFMASRAQLVEEVIRPALAAGKVVISDRFLLASMVYQGYAGGLAVADVAQVGRVATGGLLPDLTLVLDIAPEAARARVGGARDRIEDRAEEYQRRVREGFRRAAGAGAEAGVGGLGYPAPVVLIDAGTDPDTVFTRIRNEVERVLALDPRP
jgi:dTMP kinase